ncbi:hypothetical protein [Ekhidna sp.]|uniref:hypothetical protein n=1 Tax=Ekhidna sp. TaxID=2608089 RepID=UPI00351715D6
MKIPEIHDPFKHLRPQLEITQKLISSHKSNVFSELKKFHEKFNSDILDSIQKLSKTLVEYQKRSSIAYRKLAEFGWYITLETDISEPIRLTEMIEKEEVDEMELDKEMMTHFKNHFKVIRKTLLRKFPRRKEILESAFNAHKNSDYNLSIPVFFSQAEGICCDITGKKLFGGRKDSNDNYHPHTFEWVKNLERESILTNLLEPLKHKGSLNQSDSEFNRHAVLHGEDCNYGSETNSYKALSLLNFVGTIVYKAKTNSD